MHLITGYAGYEHIKSEDDGAFNAAFFGDGQNVMEAGNKFSAAIIDNNTVRVLDGDGLMFGRHFRIKPNTYEDVIIATGTANTNRFDLICATYKKNETNGTEDVYLEVIKGAEATNAVVPAYTTGNILNGATFNQMPLYKVTINGVVLAGIEPLFATIPTYKALAERYATEFQQAVDKASTGFASKSAVETAQATANTAIDNAATAQATANNAMPKNGGTFSGTVWANGSNRTNECLRNISVKDTSVTGEYQSTNSIIMVRK